MAKKAPIEQSELFKTDVGWFHIFKELIRNKHGRGSAQQY